MTHCLRCGTRLESGRCVPCHEKDIKTSSPAVFVDSDAFEVLEVRLDPIPGKLFPQPVTLEKAIALGLILTATEGRDTAFYLRSSRVRLILKPRKEI